MEPPMPGMPPVWTVYFQTDDTDATAAKAQELGGTVMVPPTDIPPDRFAAIVDPQGAVFNVIKMNPM
jgi:predicted enzyme related to lactoylglutathione lyase